MLRKSHFLFFRFNSKEIVWISDGNVKLNRVLTGKLDLVYINNSALFLLISNRNGSWKPLVKNWLIGMEPSSLVTAIVTMLNLSAKRLQRFSNLFLIELIFR